MEIFSEEQEPIEISGSLRIDRRQGLAVMCVVFPVRFDIEGYRRCNQIA